MVVTAGVDLLSDQVRERHVMSQCDCSGTLPQPTIGGQKGQYLGVDNGARRDGLVDQ